MSWKLRALGSVENFRQTKKQVDRTSNQVLPAIAIASETLVRYVLGGERQSRSATLGDFAVRELELSKEG